MEYDIKLTQQELGVVFAGLGELPLKVSVTVFAKLQQEQVKQDEAKAVTLVEDEPKGS